MKKKIKLKLLFIGNSHTFMNNMPDMVAARIKENGYDCETFMLSPGGWTLEQHVAEQQTKYNIEHGKFDYVVLQERANLFPEKETFYESVWILADWIFESGAKPVIFDPFVRRGEEERQEDITNACQYIAEETGSIFAWVGGGFKSYADSWPDIDMYADDGEHASERGSDYMAKMIYEAIRSDIVSVNKR